MKSKLDRAVLPFCIFVMVGTSVMGLTIYTWTPPAMASHEERAEVSAGYWWTYYQDPRTHLCFAMTPMTRQGGGGPTGWSNTSVPCTPEVLSLIQPVPKSTW